MKKYLKIFAVFLAFAFCFTACKKEPVLDEFSAKELAERHTHMMLDSDFEGIIADCDETVTKQMDASSLKQAWDSVSVLAGDYKAIYSSTYSVKSGIATVANILECENMAMVLSFSYKDGKICGLWLNTTTVESDLTESDEFVESFIEIGEYNIKGVVTLPKNNKNYPVAILVQGSGSSDYNEAIGANKPFKEIAHYLAEKGIASVRINKRYYQKPDLAPVDITIYDEYMEDIYSAIDYAKANISENIFVIGHSLGAMSAPKIAADNSAKGFVMLAGTIRGLEDVVHDQNMATVEKSTEYSKTDKANIIKAVQQGVDRVKKLKEGDKDAVLGIPASYWLSLRDLKAEEYLQNTDLPVLIVQGTADFQISYKADYLLMKDTFKNKEKFVFKEYDGLNHLLMPQSKLGVIDISEYREENHIPEYVLKDIAEFINSNK